MTKKLLLALMLLTSLGICTAQHKKASQTYTQKLEHGLNGPVKMMTTYYLKPADTLIKNDTSNFFRKDVKIFSRSGDLISATRYIKAIKILSRMDFTDTGQNISIKETTTLDGKNPQETTIQQIWTDDYNYKTIYRNGDSVLVTLNKRFNIIKMKKIIDGVVYTDTLEYEFNDHKIVRIKNTKTTLNGKIATQQSVQMMQAYDGYGNPTRIYSKDPEDEQAATILLKEYTYY